MTSLNSKRSNHSIERTSKKLRLLDVAHVEL